MKKLIVPLASVVLVLGLTTGSALAKGTSDLSSDISTAAQSGQVQIQETGTAGERQVSETLEGAEQPEAVEATETVEQAEPAETESGN